MDKSERIEKWDILKFILIFLVVLGHVIDSSNEFTNWMKGMFLFIYTFHMPAFIFISGLFSKNTVNNKRYLNTIPFLYMYFIAKAVIFFGRLIGTGNVSFAMFTESGLPWYMFAMFLFPLITMVLKNFSPLYVFIFSILIGCFTGYDDTLGNLFAISRIFVFYPFYFAGYCLDQEKIICFSRKKCNKLISLSVLVIFALIVFIKTDSCYWLRPLLSGKNPYSTLGNCSDFGGLYRLGYYVVSFLTASAVIILSPEKAGKGKIAQFGSRSLQVYVLQYLFIYILKRIFSTNPFPDHPGVFIFPLSVIITLACSLKLWEPLFKKILYPKQKNVKS